MVTLAFWAKLEKSLTKNFKRGVQGGGEEEHK